MTKRKLQYIRHRIALTDSRGHILWYEDIEGEKTSKQLIHDSFGQVSGAYILKDSPDIRTMLSSGRYFGVRSVDGEMLVTLDVDAFYRTFTHRHLLCLCPVIGCQSCPDATRARLTIEEEADGFRMCGFCLLPSHNALLLALASFLCPGGSKMKTSTYQINLSREQREWLKANPDKAAVMAAGILFLDDVEYEKETAVIVLGNGVRHELKRIGKAIAKTFVGAELKGEPVPSRLHVVYSVSRNMEFLPDKAKAAVKGGA